MQTIADTVGKVRSYTDMRIEWISTKLPDAQRRATLAELRRGVGSAPGALPELWGALLMGWGDHFSPDGDDPRAGHGPTYEEWAVYTALTLWAMHQQGADTQMHIEGQRIGTAVGRLVKEPDDLERVRRRFNQAATASDISEAAHYLRGLIQILRAESIGLDYAALAADLYLFQLSAESADRVRLNWGRDFYRETDKTNKNTEEAAENE